MKVFIQFKDPDAIFEILNGKHPFPDDPDNISPKLEQKREDFCEEYFEYGDYGQIEIDTETLAVRVLPRKEWK
jgi:hypothetical protein